MLGELSPLCRKWSHVVELASYFLATKSTKDRYCNMACAAARMHLRVTLQSLALHTCILALCAAPALGDTNTWNEVLERSCPFEFNPEGALSAEPEVLAPRQTLTPGNWKAPFEGTAETRMRQVASWVGDTFDPRIMQEADFDYESISTFPSNPWSTNIACGAMLAYDSNTILFDSYTYDPAGAGRTWPYTQNMAPPNVTLHPDTWEGFFMGPMWGGFGARCEDYVGPVRWHPWLFPPCIILCGVRLLL